MSTPTNIPPDYAGLLKEYLHLRHEQETTLQSLYDCKRQLKVAAALQTEYQHEIDMLQNVEKQSHARLQAKIAQLEQHFSGINSKRDEQINKLEEMVMKKEEQIAELLFQIDTLKKQRTAEISPDDSSKFLDEFVALKQENETLLGIMDELKSTLDDTQIKNRALDHDMQNLREERDGLLENLTAKRKELSEAHDLIETLNDDLVCVKNELESLKIKTLDHASRGNSLFAEVDDRRVYLQKTINNMKENYMEMKRERAGHIRQIAHLRNENAILCERARRDLEEKDDNEGTILCFYRKRVEDLENIAKNQEKRLAEKLQSTTQNSCSEFRFFEKMIASKNEELMSLERQMTSKSLEQVLMSEELADSNKDKRKWRCEATLKQTEVDMLKSRLEELEKEKKDKFGLVAEDQVEKCVDTQVEKKALLPKQPSLSLKVKCEQTKVDIVLVKKELPSKEPELKSILKNQQLIVEMESSVAVKCEENEGNLKERDVKSSKSESVDNNDNESSMDSADNKENQEKTNQNVKTTKKITFSDSTVEPETTRKPMKKGGRIIQEPKTLYFHT